METIDFFEDEDVELPPPMTQKDVILLNRAGAFQDEEAAVQAGKEDDNDDDDDAMEVGKILPCICIAASGTQHVIVWHISSGLQNLCHCLLSTSYLEQGCILTDG